MRKCKGKWKKRISLFLCFVLMISCLTACGNEPKTPDGGTEIEGDQPNPPDDPDSSEKEDKKDPDPGEEETTQPENKESFQAYDLKGVTITLLNHNNFGGLDPNAKDLEEYQKEERQANIDRIEKKYNVKLEFVPPPTDVWDDLTKEVISAYAAGQPVADVMDAYFQFLGSYVANDILYDMTDVFKNSNVFNPESYCTWMSKQWGLASGMSGEGLFYNKDMIKQLGMEKTPAEMFNEGKWSYDDFYEYCKDMKSKMAENEYPLYVSSGYWLLFAPAANGTKILGENGNLNYLEPNFLESMEFLKKLIDAGLCRKPNLTETGGYDTWGTGGATFDAGVEVAICHRAAWQIADLVGKFDIGFVPYPWGSNVKIEKTGEAGAYKTLSSNYRSSYFDGQVITLTKGVEKKADPLAVMVMVADLMNWDFASATPKESEATTDNSRWFNDPLDAEIYGYSESITRWEPYNSLDLELTLSTSKIFYGGESLRSTFESAYNADMALMIEAGYATEDVLNSKTN